MIDTPVPPPSDRKPESPDRSARLSAALRANLARRKAQARARSAEAAPPPAADGSDQDQ